MRKINFIFGVHNHQPTGNFGNVFEWAAKQSYEPFLDVIEKHPGVKIVFHYTGCLIDWLEENRPEVLNRIKTLVKKGRAEILTGGYYEPILPAIPDADKAGQIKKLSGYIKKKFSQSPKGMWLAERVWEPSLAKTLNEAGVEYIVLDDAHFLAAGAEEKTLRGYFITEDQGATLKIFPISQYLRYTMPFADPSETIKYLKSESSEDPAQLLVMADDGEKFGLWPDTYKTCYEEKWLEKFVSLLDENSDWLNVTTFSEYAEKFPARGRIYIPTASYFEMSEWSLPAKSQVDFEEISLHADVNLKRFLKGGFWRNFLTKYSESNQMHKKMLHVSNKIRTAVAGNGDGGSPEPLDYLYRGQCNCAYWHGIFGGLYLPHLRHAIYKNLIKAENLLALSSGSAGPSAGGLSTEVIDFDGDGRNEILISNKNFNVCLKPSSGGSITEIDFRPAEYNLTDVLTRRFEAYHKKVDVAVMKNDSANKKLETIHGVYYTKEMGLHKYLKYDWYDRHSLVDHFFHPSTTLEKFADCEYGELGDFVNQPYKQASGRRKSEVVLARDGNLWLPGASLPVRVVKSVSFTGGGITVGYKITNRSQVEKELWFGSEFNLSFSNPNDEKCFYSADSVSGKKEKFSAKTSFEKTKSLKISDPYGGFSMDFEMSDEFDFWVFPVWSISLSEGGFEKTYQGSSVTPNKKILLKPEETFSFEMKISASVL